MAATDCNVRAEQGSQEAMFATQWGMLDNYDVNQKIPQGSKHAEPGSLTSGPRYTRDLESGTVHVAAVTLGKDTWTGRQPPAAHGSHRRNSKRFDELRSCTVDRMCIAADRYTV